MILQLALLGYRGWQAVPEKSVLSYHHKQETKRKRERRSGQERRLSILVCASQQKQRREENERCVHLQTDKQKDHKRPREGRQGKEGEKKGMSPFVGQVNKYNASYNTMDMRAWQILSIRRRHEDRLARKTKESEGTGKGRRMKDRKR